MFETNTKHRYALWMVLAVLIVCADQLSKWAIVQYIPYLGSVELNSFMNLTHQRNFGAAWSLLADAGGWQRWFFVVLAVGVSVLISVWLWRIRDGRYLVLATGLSLVLGGAVGNLVDRLRLGYVTDFMQVWFGSWPFPSFNVADSAITVGAVLLIIDSLFISGREAAKTEDAQGAPDNS
ncbi:MAG: signal peptidase II [Pseudomonadota bacterium]